LLGKNSQVSFFFFFFWKKKKKKNKQGKPASIKPDTFIPGPKVKDQRLHPWAA